MMYIAIIFAIIIIVEAIIIYKLNRKVNGVNTGAAEKKIHECEALSDKYLKLISGFSFSVDEMYMEMKDISSRAESVMAESEEQAASMASMTEVVEDIYKKVDVNLKDSEVSSQISKKSNEEISGKITELRKNIDEFSKVRILLNDTSESIKDLEIKTLNAESLVGEINNISLQTNLLALNASIEAARAGQYGKGFTVVAEEIRNLSTETGKVTAVISEIIKELRNSFMSTKDELIEVLGKIEEQTTGIEESVYGFENIEKISEDLYDKTTNISHSSKGIEEQIYNLKEFINSVNTSVESAANSLADVNQSVEGQTRSVDSLNKNITEFENVNFEFLEIVQNKDSDKKLTVVSSPYEPFIIYDSEKDKVTGIDADIINQIYSGSEYQVEYKIVPWDTSISMIKSGLADIIPTIDFSKAREEFLDFSITYRYENIYNFYTNTEKNIRVESLADLSGRRIGVLDGYAYYSEFDNNKSFTRDVSFKEEIMFKKLLKGHVDAIILYSYSGDYFIKKLGLDKRIKTENYKHAEFNTSDTRMGYCKIKNHKKAIELFNSKYHELESNGTIDKIVKTYLT